MAQLTAQELRNLVEAQISASIEIHRGSRASTEGEAYERPTGLPTDEEIDDFIMSNPLLDEETKMQLVDPGLLGFFARTATASKSWLREFRRSVSDWSQNNAWLGADLPWHGSAVIAPEFSATKLWLPQESSQPGWLATAPAVLLLAADLLRTGRLLSDMPWRKFEEMIGALLEAERWTVQVTRPSKDGGIDVVATKEDPILGSIRAVWQAKRYGESRAVRLSEVRELSAVVDKHRATKGVIVTTSRLTKSAIEWVRQDMYRLDYKDAAKIESWIRTVILGKSRD